MTLIIRFSIRVLQRLARELERFLPEADSLHIEYRVAQRGEALGPHANHRGTHLNETKSGSSEADYLRTFSIAHELENTIVRGNVEFLERHVAPLLGAEASLVDVGCGPGKYGAIIRRAGAPTALWTYSGVERSEAVVRLASATFPEFEFHCSNDSGKLPLADQSADLVMASAALQYMIDDWKLALGEMKRVARSFVFLTRIPMTKHHRSVLVHQSVREKGVMEHNLFTVFNRDELEAAFGEAGFAVRVRDYLSETFPVVGVPELVLSCQYLLEPQR